MKKLKQMLLSLFSFITDIDIMSSCQLKKMRVDINNSDEILSLSTPLFLTFCPFSRQTITTDTSVYQTVWGSHTISAPANWLHRPRADLHDQLFCVSHLLDRKAQLLEPISQVFVLVLQLLQFLQDAVIETMVGFGGCLMRQNYPLSPILFLAVSCLQNLGKDFFCCCKFPTISTSPDILTV